MVEHQIRTSQKPARIRARYGQDLSAREIEVLSRICSIDEPTRIQAAHDLGISDGTIRLHLNRIYRKLGVHTLLGAYRVATQRLKIQLRDW